MMQKAVVETAMAYFRRGGSVMYSWMSMTVRNRKTVGESRMHAGAAPELASRDFTIYSHCADWINSVYLNALNHNVAGAIRLAFVRAYNIFKSAEEPDVVLKFGGDGLKDRAEFERLARELLQPGDIYSVSGDPDYSNGHTMLYLGDCLGDGTRYVLHCSGAKPTKELGGCPSLGRIRCADIEYFFGKEYPWGLYNEEKNQHFTIMRPINIIGPEAVTPSARARLRYPGLLADRYASVFGWGSAVAGEEITVTVAVENFGPEPYRAITVTEPLPQGGVIVADSVTGGGTLTADGIDWILDLPAGERVELTYRVRVTAGVGEMLTLPAGTVGGLATRCLSWSVAAKPLPPAAEGAAEAAVEALTAQGLTKDLSCVSEFCRRVWGWEAGLPQDMQHLLDGLFDLHPIVDADDSCARMLKPTPVEALTPEFRRLRAMIVPEHLTGQVVWLGSNVDTYYPCNRVTTLYENSYTPGDLLLCLDGEPSYWVRDPAHVTAFICLGGGRVAWMREGTISIEPFDGTVKALEKNVLIGIRPGLEPA